MDKKYSTIPAIICVCFFFAAVDFSFNIGMVLLLIASFFLLLIFLLVMVFLSLKRRTAKPILSALAVFVAFVVGIVCGGLLNKQKLKTTLVLGNKNVQLIEAYYANNGRFPDNLEKIGGIMKTDFGLLSTVPFKYGLGKKGYYLHFPSPGYRERIYDPKERRWNVED